jgi:hypothetical protein
MHNNLALLGVARILGFLARGLELAQPQAEQRE